MLISGTVLTGLYLFVLSRGHGNPWMLAPCLLIIVSGYLYLHRPYFELRDTELVVFGLMGAEVKRYTFSSLSDFSLQQSRIYIQSNGKRKRVRVHRVVAGRQEWERFTDMISGHDLTHELHNI